VALSGLHDCLKKFDLKEENELDREVSTTASFYAVGVAKTATVLRGLSDCSSRLLEYEAWTSGVMHCSDGL
jgi:hypothetical protein